MNKAFWKNILRTIKKSMGRFMAIFAIIALGVGFFSGLRVAKPAMIKTGQDYVKENKLFDYRLLSTWGFTEDEIKEIKTLEGVSAAEGAVSEDFIYVNQEGEDSILKAHSVTEEVNLLKLTTGRMPQEPNECVLDANHYSDEMIGQEIRISEKNPEETIESFLYDSYTVTGLVRSAVYMNMERGTAAIGSGRIDAFVYIPLAGFSYEYFEEVYVYCEERHEAYTQAYDDYIEDSLDGMEKETTILIENRYKKEIDDAWAEIEDAEQELAEEAAKAETELADAKKELEDGEQKLADGKKELSDAKKELENGKKELADGKKELEDGKKKLADARKELENGKKELQDAENTIANSEKELVDGETALNKGIASYESGLAEYQAGYAEYKDGKAKLNENKAVYEAARKDMNSYVDKNVDKLTKGELIGGYLSKYGEFEPISWSQYLLELFQQGSISQGTFQSLVFTEDTNEQSPSYQNTIALITEYQTVVIYEQSKQELAAAKSSLDEAKALLDASLIEIEENQKKITEGREELEKGKRELEDARIEIQRGEQEFQEGEQKIRENEQKAREAEQEIQEGEQKIRDGEQEIRDSEQELKDGWQEYEDGVQELEEETAKARKEIEDAKEEIADIEEPKVYVLDRSSNIGYVCYESDVSIVESIAKVFPIFFFLIAALVCSTTMTRMVDDERTQIGTLRALGYSNTAILSKYLIYSGSAAGTGGVFGYCLGIRLFPNVIWNAYGMLYGFSDIIYVHDYPLLAVSLLVSLICSVGAAFAACRRELIYAPAELIRPKAPAAGKRILLERIPFLWKKMKFLYKVSARNVFRFKKRMLMMILGLAGCMALVVAGYGIKDSISNVVNNQYDEILKYDISVNYSKEVTDEKMKEIRETFGDEIVSSVMLMQTSVEVRKETLNKTVTLMAGNGNDLESCIDFHLDGKKVNLPSYGEVMIDVRMADAMNLKVGDEVTFYIGEDKTKPLLISGIFENYTFYYAYVSDLTFQDYFPEDYIPKTIYLTLAEDADEYEIASYLGDMKHASDVSVNSDFRVRIENTMNRLDYVVLLVIGCAGALAFIVLFNLGNINISERVREIATLKVLGFYPRETGSYVFRENMVLSFIGMVVGVPLGILFHRFVMEQIKVDMVSFEINILPLSYVYSILTVFGFTVFVDLIMRKKIDRINMAESLKSIE